MPRIAHTADVHIRALSRHDEYRHILKAFTEDCKQQRVDHIFVGGDIFHTKVTGISPEYIDLLTWWLTDMSKVAQVHLVLGNHDGNLVNLSRQDAVSPIVEAMANPRVHLYKKSGVYEFEPGYNFCVFSCFDEEGWKDVRPVPGKVNIATFHGPVRGSTTETDWEVDEGTTVDFFSDYHFCLLGDIHKPQALGYRDGKPWIAYPGTPIQQNYAEQMDHSYLLWDISDSSDWSVETRKLPNPKPFVTVDWTGDLDKTLDAARQLPRSSRFRVRSSVQMTQDDVHRLSESLKTTMSATEVTYKSDFQIDRQTVAAGSTKLVKQDLRSPDVMMRLLRDYHKEANLSDSDVVSLTDIVKRHLTSVSSVDDFSRGAKWSLRSLKWDNLFSYGEGNVVDFDKLNGIVGIFGPNRTGKSSVVGTVMYTLFNTTDRGSMKNINICNVRKDYCTAQAVIDHDGTTYVVERQTTKSTNKKGVTSATTALNLFRMGVDGEMDDLCGEQRNDTEKTLRSLFGNSEDFLMTSISAQGETNQFLSQGSTKRRSILTRFLDLDVFDKMNDLASKEVSSIKSQLKNFPDRDWDTLTADIRDTTVKCREKIDDLTSKIAENQTMLSLLRQDLSKHNASPITVEDVDTHRARVSSLTAKSDECAGKILTLESEISDLKSKAETLQEFVSTSDIDVLKKKLESQSLLEKAIVELRHAADKEATLYNQQNKSLKILDEVPCGDDYPSCKFIKDAHANKKLLPSQLKKMQVSQKSLEDAMSAMQAIKDDTLPAKISKIEKATDLIAKLELEVSKKETDLEKQKSACDSLSASLSDAQKRLTMLEAALDADENEEASAIKQRIRETVDLIKSQDHDKLAAATQHGKLISQLEKLQEEKTSRDALLAEVRLHELVANAFSKKGIPLLVTKSQLPIINAEVTKILQGIVDFTIHLENDEDTDSLEIYIDYGDSRRVIELCSGMEKTVAAIALRVAMVNVSSLPKPNFFIIDEGFGTLDNAGVEACNRLLASLKRYFKTVIVITHVDGIKDSADHILEITKTEKDSHLEHT